MGIENGGIEGSRTSPAEVSTNTVETAKTNEIPEIEDKGIEASFDNAARARERNPILTKLSNGEVPTVFSGDRIDSMIRSGFDNVGTFGKRAAELFKNTALKGGALFTPLTSNREAPPFKFTSLGDESTQKAEVAEAKAQTETRAEEVTKAKIAAKDNVIKLPGNFTPALVLETRNDLNTAVEKTAVASSEKLGFWKLATMVIKEGFRLAKRALEIKGAEMLAASEDPEVAKKGKEILARLKPKVTALERLRALYPNLPSRIEPQPEVAAQKDGKIEKQELAYAGPKLVVDNTREPELAPSEKLSKAA